MIVSPTFNTKLPVLAAVIEMFEEDAQPDVKKPVAVVVATEPVTVVVLLLPNVCDTTF